MAELTNRSPQDPWTVTLTSSPPDDEGWRSGRLVLHRAPDPQPLVDLEANLYRDELDTLAKALAGLATGSVADLSWEPLEPSFLLRGHHWSPEEIELAWFADQGELTARTSTDTGVGVLIRVDAKGLATFAQALAAEGGR